MTAPRPEQPRGASARLHPARPAGATEASWRGAPLSVSAVPNRDKVAVVAVGELDAAGADTVEYEVHELRAAGFAQIVVDLSRVDFVDAAGLRMLLALRNHAERNRYRLELLPPPLAARRIFELTGTRALFDWRGAFGPAATDPTPAPARRQDSAARKRRS